MLPVIETFTSLQGESTYAGKRCFFIRLAGCNLRCSYCDTAYAWSGGEPRTIADLTAEAEKSECRLVEITGGEPLIHTATPQLAQALLDKGFEVMVETNGSMDISLLPQECRRIVDCKLPSSEMASHNLHSNWDVLTANDEVKFVTASREDFDYAVNEIVEFALESKTPHLIFSPVWGKISFDELAQWIIDSKLEVRMQLQLHKLIWGDKKGV